MNIFGNKNLFCFDTNEQNFGVKRFSCVCVAQGVELVLSGPALALPWEEPMVFVANRRLPMFGSLGGATPEPIKNVFIL